MSCDMQGSGVCSSRPTAATAMAQVSVIILAVSCPGECISYCNLIESSKLVFCIL